MPVPAQNSCTSSSLPRSKAVAERVAGGPTNMEAAGALFVAEKTVQYHLTRLYRKMRIRSRSELAAAFRAKD